jgi:HEAT repeat protein
VLPVLLAPGLAGAQETVPQLLEQLTRGPERAQVQAATRLYHLGQTTQAAKRLARQLREAGEAGDRARAARLLGLLRNSRSVNPLIAALADDDWEVRRDAAEALGQLGEGRARPAVRRLLGDGEVAVRVGAVRALGDLGATMALGRSLANEAEVEVRVQVVQALGQQVSPAGRHWLRRALTDSSETVRWLAATFLVEQGESVGLAVLERKLGSDAATTRSEAAAALGRAQGPARVGAGELLRQRLTDQAPAVALTAASSLAAWGDGEGFQTLRRLARQGQPQVRVRALRLLQLHDAQP